MTHGIDIRRVWAIDCLCILDSKGQVIVPQCDGPQGLKTIVGMLQMREGLLRSALPVKLFDARLKLILPYLLANLQEFSN
jgi:hypothetical protein